MQIHLRFRPSASPFCLRSIEEKCIFLISFIILSGELMSNHLLSVTYTCWLSLFSTFYVLWAINYTWRFGESRMASYWSCWNNTIVWSQITNTEWYEQNQNSDFQLHCNKARNNLHEQVSVQWLLHSNTLLNLECYW